MIRKLTCILLLVTGCLQVCAGNPNDTRRIKEALQFCQKNNLSTDYCFLIDLSKHSGKNRFGIWDLKTGTLLHSGLCCHGYGGNSSQSKPVFSNVTGSNCTALGKYKTGKRAYSNWGINIHYKLHGLERTNSNAFKRIIVLHSYDKVPDQEIYPDHLPLGWSMGCPVIDNSLMRKVDALLKKSRKPVLLWMYN